MNFHSPSTTRDRNLTRLSSSNHFLGFYFFAYNFSRLRRVLVVLLHVTFWVISYLAAFSLRFEFVFPTRYGKLLWIWLGALVLSRSIAFFHFGAFRGLWRFSGIHELVNLIKSTLASSVGFATFIVLAGYREFPRSVLVIELLGAILLGGGMRLALRLLREASEQKQAAPGQQSIIIVGAGNAGEMLLRELQRDTKRRFHCAGFLDDNPINLHEHIHGVKVLGKTHSLPEWVARYNVSQVILAMPEATGPEVRRVVELCKSTGAQIRTVPSMDHLIEGRVTLNQIRQVAIEDLLRRPPVDLDETAIAEFIRGRRVLVTGAGGSIGSELCRQICRFGPAHLSLVEQAETPLFNIHRELKALFADIELIPRIADVGDAARVESVFLQDEPHIVFHAAAHKHVPMMECNIGEAVKNNIIATRLLADTAHRLNIPNFVMVSTDKAVRPTSVMGASKRIAELYIRALSHSSTTRFSIVRFGNVLGSAGSVIPIFSEQIAKGGPVKVTHPEMTRYFMTIPEACQLILQAATLHTNNGDIFFLDMGEPVRILDLARDLIILSGLKPHDDIEIEFTGIRPGEKLYEELSFGYDRVKKTSHAKIFVSQESNLASGAVTRSIDRLSILADTTKMAEVLDIFLHLVPEFVSPQSSPPHLEDIRV